MQSSWTDPPVAGFPTNGTGPSFPTNGTEPSFTANGTASHHAAPLPVQENTYPVRANPYPVPLSAMARDAYPDQNEDDEEDEQDDDINKKTKLTLAPKSVLDNLDASPRCMFVKECKTGSQLRKAISHIFGRNKICTRQIPDNIWVHFCRKHYQRCRYRNVTEYAKLQCQLVVKQIERVQAWSDRNAARKQLGVVNCWTMGIRKREQKRMANRNPDASPAVGEKRPYPGYDLPGMDHQGPRFRCPHAVPDWLLEKSGKNFTTAGVIDIFKQIEAELGAERLREMPDVEVLPSITHDPNEEIQYKRYEKRKHAETQMIEVGHSHRRTQSTGNAYPSVGSSLSQYNPSSASGFWGASQGTQGMLGTTAAPYPFEKRQRFGEFDGGFHPQPPNPLDVAPRNESRIVPNFRPGPLAGQGYLPLPAPMAQRPGAHSTAQQLESSTTTNGFGDFWRQHQRSHSDPSNFRFHSDPLSFRYLPPLEPEPSASRFPGASGPHISASTPSFAFAHRAGPTFFPQDAPRLPGSSFNGAHHSQAQGFGNGTSNHSYAGGTYPSSNLGHSPSYSDYPPRHFHPSFSTGHASYYQQSDAAAPMNSRHGHVRHQSTPSPLTHATQQHIYGNGSKFHSTVVPEGYPPANQPHTQPASQSDNQPDNQSYHQPYSQASGQASGQANGQAHPALFSSGQSREEGSDAGGNAN